MLSDIAAALAGNLDHDTAFDRITVTAYVQQAVTCHVSGEVLDKREAVVIEELDANDEVISARVFTAKIWDTQVAPNIPADTTVKFSVLDGRELF